MVQNPKSTKPYTMKHFPLIPDSSHSVPSLESIKFNVLFIRPKIVYAYTRKKEALVSFIFSFYKDGDTWVFFFFTCIFSLNTHCKHRKQVTILSPFYGRGNWGTERLRNLPKFTDFVSGKVKIWTWGVWFQRPMLFHEYVIIPIFVAWKIPTVKCINQETDPFNISWEVLS